MNEKLRITMFKLGHRGFVLISYAITTMAYGSGIIAGYQPTFTRVGNINVRDYGFAFLGLGAFALSGIMRKHFEFFYSICVLGITAWIVLLATHWSRPFGWTAAISWLGLDLVMILSAVWPEEIHYAEFFPPIKVPEEDGDH